VAWHTAARSSDLEEGSVLGVEVNGMRVALYRIEGVVYATSDVCTHEVALLSDGYLEGECIECPLHQAQFHIPSGEVRAPPCLCGTAGLTATARCRCIVVPTSRYSGLLINRDFVLRSRGIRSFRTHVHRDQRIDGFPGGDLGGPMPWKQTS
jgi:nitrite reductase/ring-hydroxylating ferredoxin subunit